MKINTNISSTAQEVATNTNRSIASSLEKLSTGLKSTKLAMMLLVLLLLINLELRLHL